MTIKAHIDFYKILGIAQDHEWLTRASVFDGEDLRKTIEQIDNGVLFDVAFTTKRIAEDIKRLSDTNDDVRTIMDAILTEAITMYSADWDE